MFAARPLFNSATPYLDNGELNNLICFGNEDKERWKDAIDANEAVLSWASGNGVTLINTGGTPNANAFVDYATATSTPANAEIILAYKRNSTDMYSNYISYYHNCSPYLSQKTRARTKVEIAIFFIALNLLLYGLLSIVTRVCRSP